MKKVLSIATFICFFLFSCNTVKVGTNTNPNALIGNWELSYIAEHETAIGDLYPYKKPTLNFDTTNNIVSGNTGCNTFRGTYTINGSTIKFPETMAMTRMICGDNQGEAFFLSTLNKVDKWTVSDEGKKLKLFVGNISVIEFTKK